MPQRWAESRATSGLATRATPARPSAVPTQTLRVQGFLPGSSAHPLPRPRPADGQGAVRPPTSKPSTKIRSESTTVTTVAWLFAGTGSVSVGVTWKVLVRVPGEEGVVKVTNSGGAVTSGASGPWLQVTRLLARPQLQPAPATVTKALPAGSGSDSSRPLAEPGPRFVTETRSPSPCEGATGLARAPAASAASGRSTAPGMW